MSSKNLENFAALPNRGTDRFLLLLKTRGGQTSAALGTALNISDEAARQQLVKLAGQGLVEGVAEANGVGRPQQVWRLTAAGHARFPDAHADLTAQLLRSIRNELGEAALDRLITVREQDTRKSYAEELAGVTDLGARVAGLAAIRTREGYMAEWQEDDEGYLLVENHCPICAAAATCQGFCRAELDVFQQVLGKGASVTRLEHILSGDRRCAYRITATGVKPAAVPDRETRTPRH